MADLSPEDYTPDLDIDQLREILSEAIDDVEVTVQLHSDALADFFAEVSEVGRALSALNRRVDRIVRRLEALEKK